MRFSNCKAKQGFVMMKSFDCMLIRWLYGLGISDKHFVLLIKQTSFTSPIDKKPSLYLYFLLLPLVSSFNLNLSEINKNVYQGQIQDFKLGGVHLKKLHQAEGGTNIFGVFRVKNHDFTPWICPCMHIFNSKNTLCEFN